MGKLKTLAPRVTSLKPRIGHAPGDSAAAERERNQRNKAREWYHTTRWRELRQLVLVRDLYTCAMCGRISDFGMVVDHIKPHRGSVQLFWDEANLQVLCASPCHNKHKQAAEQSMPRGVWD